MFTKRPGTPAAMASRYMIFLHLLLGSGLYFSADAYVPSGSALDYVYSSPKFTMSALAFDNRSIVSEESFNYLHSPTNCRCSALGACVPSLIRQVKINAYGQRAARKPGGYPVSVPTSK